MKKKFIRFTLFFLILMQISSFCIYALDNNPLKNSSNIIGCSVISTEDNPYNTQKIKKDILYDTSLYIAKEFSSCDINTKKITYKKIVQFKEDYYLKDGSKILSRLAYITFSYDHNDVWIENFESDITDQNQSFNKSWKISSNREYLKTPSQCLVSLTWKLFNKPNFTWNFYDSSYFDVSCSKDGKITYEKN